MKKAPVKALFSLAGSGLIPNRILPRFWQKTQFSGGISHVSITYPNDNFISKNRQVLLALPIYINSNGQEPITAQSRISKTGLASSTATSGQFHGGSTTVG